MPAQLAIIVPVHNEAENILPLAQEVAAALAGQSWGYELVFVDDRSQDTTWTRILEARQADPRVRGLRLARQAGQSAALWAGLQAATSPWLATLDGDRQNDPADLVRLVAEFPNADLVLGQRTRRQDAWLRRCSARVAHWARRLVLQVDFPDMGCQCRVFKRETLAALLPFRGLHRFLPVLVSGGGFRVRLVPVNHRPRVAGTSKYGVWNRLGQGLADLLAMAWYQRRRLPAVRLED